MIRTGCCLARTALVAFTAWALLSCGGGTSRDKSSTYSRLMAEAIVLSSAMKPRSHTPEEVVANIRARAELKREADDALASALITTQEHESIVRILRSTPRER